MLGAPIDESQLEGMTQLSLQHGRALAGADYVSAVQWMHGFNRRVAQWWADGRDLLLWPGAQRPAAADRLVQRR